LIVERVRKRKMKGVDGGKKKYEGGRGESDGDGERGRGMRGGKSKGKERKRNRVAEVERERERERVGDRGRFGKRRTKLQEDGEIKRGEM
jgi:hypothetical protein